MSSTKYLVFYLVAAVGWAVDTAAADKPIPEYLHICRKSDPHLIDCMKTSIEVIRPFVVRGIPALDVPSIDPIDIGDLLVSETARSGSNGVQITAKDIKTYGASSFILRSLEVIDYGNLYNVEVFFPLLHVEGTYDINGSVLLLPIQGTGRFTGNFTDCTGNVRLQFAKKPVNGQDLVQIKKFQIKIKVGKGTIKLYNLFNGDKVLGDAINSVINQNFDTLSQDIIPLVEKALAKTLKRIATKITQNFTYEQVFPL